MPRHLFKDQHSAMVTRAHLNKFLHKRCEKITHHLKDFCSAHNPEALHLLRVEIKKLKALLCLHNYSSEHSPLDIKPLKHLYHGAGQIRTAQINISIVQDRPGRHEAFIAEQKRVVAEESALFCSNASHYLKKLKQVEEHLVQGTHDISTPKIRDLFKEGIAKLGLFFSGSALDTGSLHEARKEVKNLTYIHALLPPALAASLHVNTDYLHELQTRIGNWHDSVETLSLLQGFDQSDDIQNGDLERTNSQLLLDIKDFTAGFDQKIHADAGPAVDASHMDHS